MRLGYGVCPDLRLPECVLVVFKFVDRDLATCKKTIVPALKFPAVQQLHPLQPPLRVPCIHRD